jgi:hypothetical protein
MNNLKIKSNPSAKLNLKIKIYEEKPKWMKSILPEKSWRMSGEACLPPGPDQRLSHCILKYYININRQTVQASQVPCLTFRVIEITTMVAEKCETRLF